MKQMIGKLSVTFEARPVGPLILGNRKLFSQFNLFRGFLPSTEKILCVEEHSAFRSNALFADMSVPIFDRNRYYLYTFVNIGFGDFFGVYAYRTSEYAFYRKNFQAFGSEMSWMEKLPDGRMLIITLNIPEGLIVDGVSLRGSHGIGIVKDISKLVLRLEDFDRRTICYSVSFPDGFDPSDLRVLNSTEYLGHDILYRRDWQFEDSADGWHGSFVCSYGGLYDVPRFFFPPKFGDYHLHAGLKWMTPTGIGVAKD